MSACSHCQGWAPSPSSLRQEWSELNYSLRVKDGHPFISMKHLTQLMTSRGFLTSVLMG